MSGPACAAKRCGRSAWEFPFCDTHKDMLPADLFLAVEEAWEWAKEDPRNGYDRAPVRAATEWLDEWERNVVATSPTPTR